MRPFYGNRNILRYIFLSFHEFDVSACLGIFKEFKFYHATVAKTSLVIAGSSLSIFFVIISVCVTFESWQGYSGTEIEQCGVNVM